MRQAINFIARALWRWDVTGIGSTLLYGFGVGAMYGDDYIVAGMLYFAGTAWLTGRILAWEETKTHPQRGLVSMGILIIATLALGGSGLWIRHRSIMHAAEKREVPPKVKSEPETVTQNESKGEESKKESLKIEPPLGNKNVPVKPPARSETPTTVLQVAPTFGNLDERAIKLSQKITDSLDHCGVGPTSKPPTSNEEANHRADACSIHFKFFLFKKVLEIKNDFIKHDIHNPELDDFFRRHEVNGQPTDAEIIPLEVENVAKDLLALAEEVGKEQQYQTNSRESYTLPVNLPSDLRNRLRQEIAEVPGTVGLIVDTRSAQAEDSANILQVLFRQAGWRIARSDSGNPNLLIVTRQGTYSITEPLACLVEGSGNASTIAAKKAFASSRLLCNWYNGQMGAFLRQGGVDLEIIIQGEKH